ncbi:uncharacterized protein FIBRA_06685 [Fibroporia radiculosa]|uniref:Ferritin-like domain-containing protein n=1 Tax=Fibroporia radiculosa TaxID=599839 RepID=J4GT90_9APHY|nr:uncharacterized protein FIBRA_06685 [Fibroporia radiculosa]CCM04505.1 predicted protein [Fibroporia radiculosa]
MYAQLLAVLAAGACAILAAPVPNPDTSILQFALVLELLESSFYHGGLQKFDVAAFTDAGFPSWVRGRYEQIMQHEDTHVSFLQDALGSQAPQSCVYDFPYTDVTSWIKLSMALEGVGGSAYLGALSLLQDNTTITAAASILSIEQRHNGWISSAVLKEQPWDGAFETPLSVPEVFSIASQFIKSCPSSNPPAPIGPLPILTLPASVEPGSKIQLNFTNPSPGTQLFVGWYNGLQSFFSTIDSDLSTVVPNGLNGTAYAGVVANDTLPRSNNPMVTALAVAQFPFNSMAM